MLGKGDGGTNHSYFFGQDTTGSNKTSDVYLSGLPDPHPSDPEDLRDSRISTPNLLSSSFKSIEFKDSIFFFKTSLKSPLAMNVVYSSFGEELTL